MQVRCRYEPAELLAQAADKLGVESVYLRWFSWPEVFPSTSGPRGGIGGQAMTTFQVHGFWGYDEAP